MRAVPAVLWATSAARRSRSTASTDWRCKLSLPFSTLSKSRMSFTSRTSRSQLPIAISTICRCFSGRLSSAPDETSPNAARSDVSGVLSSWLTVDINSSFILSSRRRSETSWNATTMPETLPSSISGLALYSTGIAVPSRRQNTSLFMRIGSQRRSACNIGLVEVELGVPSAWLCWIAKCMSRPASCSRV